jgi:mediator of RNA polymerase II transcription subunit 1
MRDELESERPLKLVTAHAKMEPSLPPQLMVEGMMKSLDTKFQIPKLSARSSNLSEGDSKKQSSDKTAIGGTESSNRMDSGAKGLDLAGKGDSSNASAKFQSLSKTTDDLKGTKIVASVTAPTAISSLTTQALKQPPSSVFLSVSSKLQDMSIDTGAQVAIPTSAAAITSVPSSSSEPSSGEQAEVSRMKPDLSRSAQISGNNVKEETAVQAIGKLENPTKSFSANNNNNDPTVLPALHPNKSLDSSQNKFSSPASQKQAEDSKKLINLGDISSKSTGLNKITPMPTTSQEAAEILLDMSASTSLPNKSLPADPQPGKLATVPERAVAVSAPSRRNTPPPPLPPPQPSVQVHIVQSPAATPTTASPLVITSPHSASPCSIDDELMDEALVGMGK